MLVELDEVIKFIRQRWDALGMAGYDCGSYDVLADLLIEHFTKKKND